MKKASVVVFSSADWHSNDETLPQDANAITRNDDLHNQVHEMRVCAEKSIANNPSAARYFVHCGDVFDKNRPSPAQYSFVEELFGELLGLFREIHVLVGNHDASDSGADALVALEGRLHKEGLVVHRNVAMTRFGSIPVTMIPHLSRRVLGVRASVGYNEAVEAYLKKRLYDVNGGMVFGHAQTHGAVAGAESRSMVGGVMLLGQLEGTLGIYGHVHKPQKTPGGVYYVGSPVRTDTDERDEEKRFLIVHDGVRVESVQLFPQERYQIDLDYTNSKPPSIPEIAGPGLVKLKILSSESKRGTVPLFDIIETINETAFVSSHELVTLTEDPSKKTTWYADEAKSDGVVVGEWLASKEVEDDTAKVATRVCTEELAQVVARGVSAVAGGFRPTRLRIQNFINIGECDVKLPQGVSGIMGRWEEDPLQSNESGKSSLVEAIHYACAGASSRGTVGDLCNDVTREDMEVKLLLRSDAEKGPKITVTRGQSAYDAKGARKKRATSYAELRVGNDIVATGDEVTAKLAELLGVDAATLAQTCFFFEQSQDDFLIAKPPDRKQYLQRFFRLDRFEKAQARVKSRRTAARKERDEQVGSLRVLKGKIEAYDPDQEKKTLAEKKADIPKYEKLAGEVRVQITKAQQSGDLRDRLTRETARLSKVEKTISDCEATIADENACANLEKGVLAQERLPDAVKQFGELQSDVDRFKDRLADVRATGALLKKRLADLPEVVEGASGVACPTCAQTLAADQVTRLRTETEKALTTATAKYRMLKERLDTRKQEADKLSKQISQDEELVRTAEIVKTKKAEATSGLKESRGEKRECAKLVKELEKAAGEAGDIDVTAASARLQKIESVIADVREGIGAITRALAAYEEATVKVRDEETKLAACERRCVEFDWAVTALDKNGAVSVFLQSVVAQVESRANDILHKLTDGRAELKIENFAQTQSSVRDGVEVWVSEGATWRRYSMYSGGARSLINVAVRVGLSLTLAELQQFKVTFLVLDEVLGKLDTVNQDRVVRLLDYVKDRFSQVLFITHTDLKDCFQNTITVERGYNGVARVVA